MQSLCWSTTEERDQGDKTQLISHVKQYSIEKQPPFLDFSVTRLKNSVQMRISEKKESLKLPANSAAADNEMNCYGT